VASRLIVYWVVYVFQNINLRGSIKCLCLTACGGIHETYFKYDKNFVVAVNINRQLCSIQDTKVTRNSNQNIRIQKIDLKLHGYWTVRIHNSTEKCILCLWGLTLTLRQFTVIYTNAVGYYTEANFSNVWTIRTKRNILSWKIVAAIVFYSISSLHFFRGML
jgi:hypothetical protein